MNRAADTQRPEYPAEASRERAGRRRLCDRSGLWNLGAGSPPVAIEHHPGEVHRGFLVRQPRLRYGGGGCGGSQAHALGLLAYDMEVVLVAPQARDPRIPQRFVATGHRDAVEQK